MRISLLQLNINSDNFWDKLVPFLKTSDFDVLHLQEVTGKDTYSGNVHSTRDTFEELQHVLGERYTGELAKAGNYTSAPQSSYMGNATFYKKSFSLVDKQLVWLKRRETPFPSSATTFEEGAHILLHLTLKKDEKIISFLNTHFAWAKSSYEEPHQTLQGDILIQYLKTVPAPFIFSADMNLNSRQPAIQKINELARNLTIEYGITNTLNPRAHRAKELFPQGVAVDYIFVSHDMKVLNCQALTNEDISDHIGLTTTIEI